MLRRPGGFTPNPVGPDPKPIPLDDAAKPAATAPESGAPTVTPESAPTPTPESTPNAALGSIEFTATVARDRSAPYKFTLTGVLKAKPGSTLVTAQCSGSVRITILRGAKTVATKDAAVALNAAGQCAFKLDVRVPRGNLARRGSLKAKVAFLGSGQLGSFSAPGHVKLKYG